MSVGLEGVECAASALFVPVPVCDCVCNLPVVWVVYRILGVGQSKARDKRQETSDTHWALGHVACGRSVVAVVEVVVGENVCAGLEKEASMIIQDLK